MRALSISRLPQEYYMSEEQQLKDDFPSKPKKEKRSAFATLLMVIWYLLLGVFALAVLAFIALFIVCSL